MSLCCFLLQAGEAPQEFDHDLLKFKQRLNSKDLLRVKFQAEKILTGVEQPFVMRGHLIRHSQRGLLWIVEYPFYSLHLIREDGVWEADTPQGPKRPLHQPYAIRLKQLLMQLFRADIESLKEGFTISVTREKSNWLLELKPELFWLSKAIERIEIRLDRTVESIFIYEVQGAQLRLSFSEHQNDDPELQPDEEADFSP